MEHHEFSIPNDINVQSYRLISYGLVASMMACAAITVISFTSHLDPSWQPYYLVAFTVIVALERLYTYRHLQNWMIFSKEWLISLAAQAITIMFLAKVMTGLSHGWDMFVSEIPRWGQDFFTYFFNKEVSFALILALFTWVICGEFAGLIEEIGPDQFLESHWNPTGFNPQKVIPARRRLLGQFFGLGAFLAVLTALSRFDPQMIVYRENLLLEATKTPALAAGGATTLLYFMLGLALFSQTQFISLRVRWSLQRIPVSGKLARQWVVYSLLFLCILVLLVSILPTSYALQPLAVLGSVLNWLLFALLFVGRMLLLFWVYVFGMLLKLFGQEPPAGSSINEAPEMPEPLDIGTLAGLGWWELTKILIFWALFLAVLFFAIRQYIQQHRGAFEWLRRLPGWHLLGRTWEWLKNVFARAKDGVTSIIQAVRERAQRPPASTNSWGGWMNPRKLNPRQRVYFFYLALVRRAGEKGLPRGRSQTPEEYAAALGPALPDAGDDIEALTKAFVGARYSREPVEPEQASRVESAWGRIRKMLRGKLGIR